MQDTWRITIRGGKGGDGRVSFLREYARPRGGPDGGDGGDGGNVQIIARANLRSLGHLRGVFTLEAQGGKPGMGKDSYGHGGKSVELQVPVGTVVWELAEDGSRKELVDLAEDGQVFIGAWGGRGGRGNHRFAGPTNQEPMLAEAGEPGQERSLLLEVKLLGDVGIVGLPNAGKSTLLAALTRAQPKIADYPFTTLEPNLGVVEHRGRVLVLLDVPGLIEGAHEGKGLGLEFLRHVERVRAIVHLVDASGDDPVEAYRTVVAELEAYPGELASKPVVMVANKADTEEAQVFQEELTEGLAQAAGQRPLWISAAGATGLEPLLDRLVGLVPEECPIPAQPAEQTRPVAGRPKRPKAWRDDEVLVVDCPQLERYLPVVNLNHWRTRVQLHAEMERLGVLTVLSRLGVEQGDTVRIGEYEMEWV
ncbi:MAG: GTPase ObgE [Chloroflexota bacterium]